MSVSVLDLRSLVPLDLQSIKKEVLKSGLIFTVEENTGDITTTFTTNFANANYSVTAMGGRSGGTASFFIRYNDNVTAPTTSTVRYQFIDADGSGTDGDRASMAGHGDLA